MGEGGVCCILKTIIALVWHSFSSEKCRIIILVFFFWRGLTLSSFLSLQDPLDEGYAEGNSDEHYRLEGKLSQYTLLTSDFLFRIKQFYYFSPWINYYIITMVVRRKGLVKITVLAQNDLFLVKFMMIKMLQQGQIPVRHLQLMHACRWSAHICVGQRSVKMWLAKVFVV